MKHLGYIVLALLFSILNAAKAAEKDEQLVLLDGTKLEQSVVLKSETFKTAYKTETVDDTCFRDVQKGTKQQCETPSWQECDKPSHQECGYESHQECDYGPDRQECGYGADRQECSYGPDRRECSTGPSHQECQTSYTQECKEDRECRIVNGQRVCETHPTCSQVPHQECHMVPGQYECRIVPGQYECRRVPGQYECHYVKGDYQCHTVQGEYTCKTVYDTPVCHTKYGTPVCTEVPNIVSEPYACQKTVQVPYQVKDHDAVANVLVRMAQLPSQIRVDGAMSVNLSGDQFSFKVGKSVSGKIEDSTDVIWFVDKKDESSLSGTNKQMNINIRIAAVPIADLTLPLATNIQDIALLDETLSFSLPEVNFPELYRLNFQLRKKGGLFSKGVKVDKEFGLKELNALNQNGRTQITLELKDLDLPKGSRKSGKYDVAVGVKGVLDESKIYNKAVVPKSLETKGQTKIKIEKN